MSRSTDHRAHGGQLAVPQIAQTGLLPTTRLAIYLSGSHSPLLRLAPKIGASARLIAAVCQFVDCESKVTLLSVVVSLTTRQTAPKHCQVWPSVVRAGKVASEG